MRLLVMGCGGMGGVTTALLAESGHDVTTYTTNAAIADAIDRSGLTLHGSSAARTVRARVVREVPKERFDVVLLCTQPPQVEVAARAALPALAEDGAMVCFQNGLCEARVATVVAQSGGRADTVGAVVAWGAAMLEPGVYERTADGGFALGMHGPLRERSAATLGAIAQVLEVIGPVELTDNLAGKRWSKLAINAAISALGTIGGDRLGALLQHRFVRRLGLEIMTECVLVARAEGVRLEKVSGTVDLDWLALTPEEKGGPSLVAKHAMLLAVGFRYRRMRSSMLAAIERGRTPAVDFLNGEVCERGRAAGIATPMNDAARAFVWQIARGERKSSLDSLRDLTSSEPKA